MSKSRTALPADPAAVAAKRILVAVDDGYAQTKVYGRADDGSEVSLIIPSIIKSGYDGITAIDGPALLRKDVPQTSGWYETEEHHQFTVGQHIDGERTAYDGYHWSKANRVMVNHALRVAGFGGRHVDLLAGLPVKDYYRGAEKNSENISRKIANLMVPVIPVAESRLGIDDSVKVGSVKIASQAVAAMIDVVVDDDGNLRGDTGAPRAVVDIGGRTTDIAVVVDGATIDHARTGTENVGVIDCREMIIKALDREIDGTLPTAHYDQAIRTGSIRLFGRELDVSATVDKCKRAVADRIATTIQRHIGKGIDLDSVIFVGGGASVFGDLAGAFRHGIVPESPEMANVRGIYKLTRL